jgi:hypothetical protein
MNLARAVEHANSVQGPKAAARLYNDIEHELALGAGGSEEGYEHGEQALGILEQRYPDVSAQARSITDPPRISRKARKTLDEKPRPLDAKPRRQHEIEGRQHKGLRSRAVRATQLHARPRRGRGGGGWGSSRRFAQTGIPDAADSVAELTMKSIGVIVGLSFFGLLVGPKGSKALTTASSSATSVLGALISPTSDPLQPSSWPTPIAAPTKTGTVAGTDFASSGTGSNLLGPAVASLERTAADVAATHPKVAVKGGTS